MQIFFSRATTENTTSQARDLPEENGAIFDILCQRKYHRESLHMLCILCKNRLSLQKEVNMERGRWLFHIDPIGSMSIMSIISRCYFPQADVTFHKQMSLSAGRCHSS